MWNLTGSNYLACYEIGGVNLVAVVRGVSLIVNAYYIVRGVSPIVIPAVCLPVLFLLLRAVLLLLLLAWVAVVTNRLPGLFYPLTCVAYRYLCLLQVPGLFYR